MSIRRRSSYESLAFMQLVATSNSSTDGLVEAKKIIEIALNNSYNPFIILLPSTIMISELRNGIPTLPPRGICIEIFGIPILRIQPKTFASNRVPHDRAKI
ncbi:hypothetical protein PanWU01x14_278360 [Parasponia andersonii]|uniref:Uncharacterized protein n=1 Tax=Parasponia andersonii TaxID=3476 RepID=A0A2P5B2B4_PARAD|nr:hypothetical protein PanWU01x14_278360 [Parasponia andersonii]